MLTFPPDFLWGAATSAYQIEGATREFGRGESIWDRFAAEPGRIEGGDDPSMGCDHYRRWPDDVELMKWLGLNAYRFSISWPRVLPTGDASEVNARGLDFYDRLVDALLEGDITPAATLYHWDLPQALQDRGGWPNRNVAQAFVDYADVVTRRLGDRVRLWITHNEPSIVSWLGHLEGVHAPGQRSGPKALAAAHHVLLSHGLAVPVIRANAPRAEVGITLMLLPTEPASPSQADLEACRAVDGMWNRWFLDPLYGRGYPDDAVEVFADSGHLPGGRHAFGKAFDLEVIATPTDFLGVNYYSRGIVRSEAVPESENAPRTVVHTDEQTDMGWEVHPQSLQRVLLDVAREYGPPRLYITENGAAYATPPSNGRVPDARRIRYLDGHLRAAHAAIAAGVPLAGYFVWSLLDNFEWTHGFAKRFGIVWVDYETGARIPKDSARWYRRVIAQGGLDEGNP
jgi:beta-glucosidase